MKTNYLFFAIVFFAFCSTDTFAQYGNNINGVDRSIGSSVRENRPPKNKQEKVDYAESAADYLKKELKLDGLQEAAVKSIINDNKGSLEEISKMDISYEEKRDKMQLINDKINRDILKILSKEQAEKYNKMKEEREKKALRS